MAVTSPLMVSPETVICRDWFTRVTLWGASSTFTRATEDRGTVPPKEEGMAMDRRASRLAAEEPLPRTTTSSSLFPMVTVVAVAPDSSERTAAPTAAAVRPYWEAASRFMVMVTCSTSFPSEVLTSTASGSWLIWADRSLAIITRVS